MSVQDIAEKLADKMTKDAFAGNLSFKSDQATPKYGPMNSGKITLIGFPIIKGRLEKVEDEQTKLSNDLSHITYTGKQFERTSDHAVRIQAQFAGDELAIYDIADIVVPDELFEADDKTLEKFSTASQKKIMAGLKKAAFTDE